jgi:hypothetical protein
MSILEILGYDMLQINFNIYSHLLYYFLEDVSYSYFFKKKANKNAYSINALVLVWIQL